MDNNMASNTSLDGYNTKQRPTITDSVRANLYKTFQAYDTDGSGTLHREEIKVMMAQLGKDLSNSEIDSMIASIDRDHSGEIDFEEFLMMLDDKGMEQGPLEGGEEKEGISAAEVFETRDDGTYFDEVKKSIQLSWFFKATVWIYAHRALFLLCVCHLVATVVIWVHYALVRYEQQMGSIPEDANRYWAKRIIRPFLFGSKHAILFQMALVPLTMARYTISHLSHTIVAKIVPLNKVLEIHIYLGKCMMYIVFMATFIFILVFGLLCGEGEEQYCQGLSSEIMVTGYLICILLLAMFFTSIFRFKIDYDLFYPIHFLFVVVYILTGFHTVDYMQRTGAKERAQTFQWFAASFMYYVADYTMLYINQCFKTNIASFTTVTNAKSKMVILSLERPSLFLFQPGQYAFIRVLQIDSVWHPFTIASDPTGSTVDFYIEVFKPEDWTGKLHVLLTSIQDSKSANGRHSVQAPKIDLMGPYGNALVKANAATHVVAIGVGTGIVPMMSLLREHVNRMLIKKPETFLQHIEHREKLNMRVVRGRQASKKSLYELITTRTELDPSAHASFQERGDDYVKIGTKRVKWSSIREMLRAGHDKYEELRELKLSAKYLTYRTALAMIEGIFGICVFGLLVLFGSTTSERNHGMVAAIATLVILLQVWFMISVLFLWDVSKFLAFIDVMVVSACIYADAFFGSQLSGYSDGWLPPHYTLLYFLFGYIVLRIYFRIIDGMSSTYSGFEEQVQRLDFVWSVRSARIAGQIYPDICEVYDLLVDKWGKAYTDRVLRININITDRDAGETATLRTQIKGTSLYQDKHVFFIRPKFGDILENHTLEMIETKQYSSTVIGFCGSPGVSDILKTKKASLDLLLAATGNTRYGMEYVSESYGGPKAAPTNSTSRKIGGDEKEKRPTDYKKYWECVYDDALVASNVSQRKTWVSLTADHRETIREHRTSMDNIEMGSGRVTESFGPVERYDLNEPLLSRN